MHYLGKYIGTNSFQNAQFTMHIAHILISSLGQFAIEYFHVYYKAPYVVGAVIIACTAVTAALWIFFKLREHWMNQWYKRLGCAIVMAVAVCGK